MEDYIVQQKGTEDTFYVLRMPEQDGGIVLLAKTETGTMHVVRGIEAFTQHFEFHSLVDEDDDESPQT